MSHMSSSICMTGNQLKGIKNQSTTSFPHMRESNYVMQFSYSFHETNTGHITFTSPRCHGVEQSMRAGTLPFVLFTTDLHEALWMPTWRSTSPSMHHPGQRRPSPSQLHRLRLPQRRNLHLMTLRTMVTLSLHRLNLLHHKQHALSPRHPTRLPSHGGKLHLQSPKERRVQCNH